MLAFLLQLLAVSAETTSFGKPFQIGIKSSYALDQAVYNTSQYS